jgi:hypothetical protein
MNLSVKGRKALALLIFFPALVGAQTPKLLPTESVARQIEAIRIKLAEPLGGTPFDTDKFERDKADHEQEFARLREVVASFVIAQLEAEPKLSTMQLRAQLIDILDRVDDGVHKTLVFRTTRLEEKDPLVWAVVYNEDAHYGLGGSRIVIDSYSVEKGKARLAGRGGSEMDGYALEAESVYSPSLSSITILIHGRLGWASGHELPAGAVLYGVNQTGVRALWTLNAPGLVFVGRVAAGFVIQYHDEERHAANLPDTALDVYITNQEPPRRAVHEYID